MTYSLLHIEHNRWYTRNLSNYVRSIEVPYTIIDKLINLLITIGFIHIENMHKAKLNNSIYLSRIYPWLKYTSVMIFS